MTVMPAQCLALAGLARLAGGVAAVALGLALGRLGRVADHLLDGFAPFARLALGSFDRLAGGALFGFLGLLRLALGVPDLAGRGDGRPLLALLDHLGIVSGGTRAEPFQRLLPC